MAGLLDPNAMKDAPPQEEPPAPEAEAATVSDDAEMEEATPEEQARYEEFVKAGYGVMYEGGEVNPAILKMLDEDPSDLMEVLQNAEEMQQFSPVVALAATAAIITLKACEETGEKDGAIIMHGGKAILEDIVEVAEKAGIREYSEDDMANAFRMGADLFREAAAEKGIIDLDQAKQEWGEIEAADKEGRLGEVMPQLAKAQVMEEPEGGA